jgi:glycerophosphoryl diester phosphodiesterase
LAILSSDRFEALDLPPVIGHRGAKGRAPENTLAGLREAHRLGCRWVEFDVMLSADGIPVLIHDETVDRTTDGGGAVAAMTYAALRRLNAAARFPALPPEPIPRLEEALALGLKLRLGINVEIKPAKGHAVATAERTVTALQHYWPGDNPALLISSFERACLEVARDLAPRLARGLLAETLPPDWEAAITALDCVSLHLRNRDLSLAEVRGLAERQVPVLAYTVNEPARAKALLGAGAVAVFTDLPDVILAALPRERPGLDHERR